MTMNFSDILGYVVFYFNLEIVHIFKSLKVAYRRMAIANNEGGGERSGRRRMEE